MKKRASFLIVTLGFFALAVEAQSLECTELEDGFQCTNPQTGRIIICQDRGNQRTCEVYTGDGGYEVTRRVRPPAGVGGLGALLIQQEVTR